MIRKFSLLGALTLVGSTAFAEDHGHAIGFKAGALGLGIEYTYQINERFALRGGINDSNYDTEGEESDITYNLDVVWDSIAVGVDLHPMKSPFRLSAGVLSSDNRIEALSRPTTNVTIGDTVYTPSEVGTLAGVAHFDDTMPFLGLGWDWSRNKKRFGVSLDLGLVDQGKAQVELIGTGSLLGDPAFRADIEAEEAELEDSLEDLEIAPFATLGFMFRF
jgi:hypothetical protein